MARLARAKQPTTFEVEGWGNFPIDMLRYDNCRPYSEQDSYKIQDSYIARSAHRKVKLICFNAFQEPAVGRWESFGWRVAI